MNSPITALVPQRDRPPLFWPLATPRLPRPGGPRDWLLGPCSGKASVSLPPPLRGRKGWVRRLAPAVAAAGLHASPSSSHGVPGLRSTEMAVMEWATLAWLEPRSPTLGCVRLTCPGPQWDSLGRWVAQHRSPAGPVLLVLTGQCVPTHTVQPPARVLSVPPPTGPPRPPHAPSYPSCSCVWCRALSPGAGSAHPPCLLTPGASLCRFLNVILKSGK